MFCEVRRWTVLSLWKLGRGIPCVLAPPLFDIPSMGWSRLRLLDLFCVYHYCIVIPYLCHERFVYHYSACDALEVMHIRNVPSLVRPAKPGVVCRRCSRVRRFHLADGRLPARISNLEWNRNNVDDCGRSWGEVCIEKKRTPDFFVYAHLRVSQISCNLGHVGHSSKMFCPQERTLGCDGAS